MKWVTRWGYEMEPKPVAKGVYRLKGGGFFIRARVADRAGEMVPIYEVARALRTIAQASNRRAELIAGARAEQKGQARSKQLWSDFAVSLLEERVGKGSIESAATVEWWQNALNHYLVPAFGNYRATDVTRADIDEWLTKTVLPWRKTGHMVQRMRKGEPFGKPRLVKPTAGTINGWLRILRNISNAIQVKFDLAKSAFDGITFLREGRTYTREEPNSLPPEVVHRFLAIARAKYPQHFFMILLGFMTGLRPSSMRALRRQGPAPDLDWETGELQVRRSHSRGQAVMDATKTKRDNAFPLPASMLEEARRHVDTLPEGPARTSDLLFPTSKGKLRTRSVLAKPFKAIVAELELPYRVTPRAMRRSFGDLMRAHGVDAAVQMSISGHQTEEMRIHYSTPRSKEQTETLEKVHRTVSGKGK